MLRLVVDTNVYVSAAISPAGSPMALIEAAQRGEVALVMCEALHAEVAETLERQKFRKWITLDEAADFLAAVTLLAEWADDRPLTEIPKVCEDAGWDDMDRDPAEIRRAWYPSWVRTTRRRRSRSPAGRNSAAPSTRGGAAVRHSKLCCRRSGRYASSQCWSG
jgi:putative PIN family toxin of toxin-antitoxin system